MAFFWAAADWGMILVGPVGFPPLAADPGSPYRMSNRGGGFSFGLAHVVNSRRGAKAVDFRSCLQLTMTPQSRCANGGAFLQINPRQLDTRA